MRDDNASPNSSPPNSHRQPRPSAIHAPSSSSSTASPTALKQAPTASANAKAQTQRPSLRNNFDLEPNPFEQSFSVSSRTSLSSSSLSSLKAAATGTDVPNSSDGGTNKPSSPQSDKKSPTLGSNGSAHSRKSSLAGNDGETPKPILPPLASITSPSDPSYAWSFSSAGISNSLRSGPLSPAMLAGPQTQPPVSSASQPASSVAALAASAASVHPPLFGFDPSGTFRTGLTPSTGLTPLVGGPVAFPPPSPNTAAFLAMMNSSSAGAAGATITPNTLSALTGVLQQVSGTQSSGGAGATTASSAAVSGAPPTSVVSASTYTNGSVPRYASTTTTTYPLATSQSDNSAHYANPSSAANAAANGLFLLSQAHQELTKREEAQKQSQAQANGSAQNQNNPNTNGNSASAKRGSKRKNDAPSVTTQSSTTSANKGTTAAPKRTRTSVNAGSGANTRSAARRSSTTASSTQDGDEDMNEDGEESDEDDGGQQQMAANGRAGQQKKPETEEEKRRNFLERNRQAALKCRQRKKAWLAQLQAKVEFLQNENERLTAALVSSREEISRLSALVGSAGVGLPITGVPVGGMSALGVGAGHSHAVGQPATLAHHLQHPHTMQVPHHLGQHHIASQHPVAVSVSLPPGTTMATAHVQASPPMVSKGAPPPHSPHSGASEGRSSRSSFRDYREVRDHRERELNGHAPQAVAVNGRGYGY